MNDLTNKLYDDKLDSLERSNKNVKKYYIMLIWSLSFLGGFIDWSKFTILGDAVKGHKHFTQKKKTNI